MINNLDPITKIINNLGESFMLKRMLFTVMPVAESRIRPIRRSEGRIVSKLSGTDFQIGPIYKKCLDKVRLPVINDSLAEERRGLCEYISTNTKRP